VFFFPVKLKFYHEGRFQPHKFKIQKYRTPKFSAISQSQQSGEMKPTYHGERVAETFIV